MRINKLGAAARVFFGKPISSQSSIWKEKMARLLMQGVRSLPNLLDLILSDDFCASSVASRSYLHANGFTKIVLAESEHDRSRLRLHIWPENYANPADHFGDLHDHRWPFVSLPILGRFKEVGFNQMPNGVSSHGETMYLYRCRPREEERLYLSGFQECRIIQRFEVERISGRSYFCEPDEIHAFRPSLSSLAASLVVTGEPVKTFARVYRSTIISEDELSIPSPAMTVAELRDKLTLLARNI